MFNKKFWNKVWQGFVEARTRAVINRVRNEHAWVFKMYGEKGGFHND